MAVTMSVILLVFALFAWLYFYNQAQFKHAEKQYAPAGKFVTVDDCKIHYISKGEGPPVVFLHGGILSSRDFEEAVDLAAEKGYRAIAFDRPGYGYSERPKSRGKVTPVTQAEMIRQALKEIGVDEPIILVGHSWSGTMTLSYAIHYPEEVADVVTVAAAMYKEGYPAEHGDLLSKLITTPVLGDFMLNTLLKTPLAKGMASSMVKATFAPEEATNWYTEEVFALGFRPAHFKANREDVLAFPGTSFSLCGRYKEITVPVTILVGEKDPFHTIEQGQRLKKDIPHAVYKEVPNIGHMIPELHPEIVIESINEISKKTASLK